MANVKRTLFCDGLTFYDDNDDEEDDDDDDDNNDEGNAEDNYQYKQQAIPHRNGRMLEFNSYN